MIYKPEEKSWEVEFTDKFCREDDVFWFTGRHPSGVHHITPLEVKDFISQLLKKQAEEIEKGLALLVLAYPELKVAIKSVLYDQNKIKSTVLEEEK